MPSEESGDDLEMTALPGFATRSQAEVALEVLHEHGIPAILSASGVPCVRVPTEFAEEARDILARGAPPLGPEIPDAPTPVFWSTGLALVSGFFALLVVVWVLNRLLGVFH